MSIIIYKDVSMIPSFWQLHTSVLHAQSISKPSLMQFFHNNFKINDICSEVDKNIDLAP